MPRNSIGRHGFAWTTTDEDNPALALVVDNTSKALHIIDADNIASDWNVSADDDPAVYIHSNDTPITEYIKMYHDATNAYLTVAGTAGLDISVPTSQTIGLQVNAVDMLNISSTGLLPAVNIQVDTVDILIGDTDILIFGDGTAIADGDVQMAWDATGLTIVPRAACGWSVGGTGKGLNVTQHGTYTVGKNDTGYDFKLFGATASCYMLWDESDDALLFAHDGASGGLIYTDVVDDHFLSLEACDTTAGTYSSVIKIQNAAAAELSFFAQTPAAQQTKITDASDATDALTRVNAIIDILELFGLCASA